MPRPLPYAIARALRPLRRLRQGAAVKAKTGKRPTKSLCKTDVFIDPVYLYFSDEETRRQPPLIKNKRRPSKCAARMAEANERQHLIALILNASESALEKLRPAVAELASVLEAKRTAYAPGYDFQVLARTCAQQRKRNGKLDLPILPDGLQWPRKKYCEEHRNRGVDILTFLEKEWRSLIDNGYGEMRWLRLVDRSAARAITNFQRPLAKSNKRRRLPEHLRFLVEREVTDRKLSFGLAAFEIDPKLPETIAGRLRRGTQVFAR
jgi:hypothetical protein